MMRVPNPRKRANNTNKYRQIRHDPHRDHAARSDVPLADDAHDFVHEPCEA